MSMRHTQPPRPLVYLDTVRNSPYVDGHILRWLTFSFILRFYAPTPYSSSSLNCAPFSSCRRRRFSNTSEEESSNIYIQSDYFHDSLVAETTENVESN